MNNFDMTKFTEAKSDQINADDLISGPRTITITRVSQGSAEQPVNVNFDGDEGKPFRPCKTMRRVMVAVWGKDAKDYVGKSMTIYRDPKVQWGGMEVGGIRISHMSHLDETKTLALMATRGKRKPYVVKPLKDAPPSSNDVAQKWADQFITAVQRAPDSEQLEAFVEKKQSGLADAKDNAPGLYERCMNALDRKRAEFNPPENETVSDEGWPDDDNTSEEGWPEEQSDETPAWQGKVDQLREDIADANGRESWSEAEAAFKALAEGLPDDVAADLRNALNERKAELMKG